MKRLNFIPVFNLQLFAEGGAAAGGAGDGGTAQGQGVTAGAASQQTKGALADVKYGIQPEETAPAAEVQKETAAPPDLNAEFEALIKGKFKAQYDARMQNTIQKRIKDSKETAQKLDAVSPILEMLGKKYGVDASDINALNKAIEEDDSYYEAEALERDMTVDQLKMFKKLERENKDYARRESERQKQEKADRLHSVWLQQEQATKQVYPSFNMEAELQNPEFVNLITNNVDVKTAYEVIHRDEIIPAAMQFAAQAVEQNISKKIAANGVRPSENGTGSRASAVVKSDVSKLTKMDIDEVTRRVAKGERISFG
jgi:hypothetical protein